MGCEHTLFSPGDEENFTHRPGILHLHKSVMVDAFGVVFRDAHRHRAHFVLQTLRGAQTTWRQEINYMSLAVNYTDLAFKRPFKNRKTTPNAGWLLVHHTPILYSTLCPLPSTSLCVCVCLLCSHVPSQSIFSNTLDLHLELQAVFTQNLQKGTINNSTEKCYVIQNVV